MKDVAREAGVALGTVSRVFNGINVGEEYRIRVLDAASRLGYSVNQSARNLKSNKTNTICLILPALNHPYFSELAEACSKQVQQIGYNLLVATSGSYIEAENQCIANAVQNQVSGIICLSYNPDLVPPKDIPFVSIDRYYDNRIPCICSDNYGGGRLAAKKLHELGCKKLLMFHEASSIPGEPDKRISGFIAYCQEAELPYDMKIVRGRDGLPDFYQYIDEHVKDGSFLYDGIFCGTDWVAVKVISYLRLKKIAVPEAVQVIGFDGTRPFIVGDYMCSTIVQPAEDLISSGLKLLLSDETSFSPIICLPVTYAWGGSTKQE